MSNNIHRKPSLLQSVAPIIFLAVLLVSVIIGYGADHVGDYSYLILLSAAGVAFVIARYGCRIENKQIWDGIVKSAKQLFPTMPILILIAMVSASWMCGGIVPTLIYYGLHVLDIKTFLLLSCLICCTISVFTGSSWTTCATIGVALMGIGRVMGYSDGMIAGAVISGAYFGDKVSPLSDTTVLASSVAGVKLFDHVKYLLVTTIPALLCALTVFLLLGLSHTSDGNIANSSLMTNLCSTFTISPWLLLAPVATCTMIMMRFNSYVTLGISTLIGVTAMFVCQPYVLNSISEGSNEIYGTLHMLWTDNSIATGDKMLDSLVETGGVTGIFATIKLILSAMVFGGIMMGAGMLACITRHFTAHLHSTRSVVSATVASGLVGNCTTGDQYLSIIINANLYKRLYEKLGLQSRLLSRTLEDSISVTSVLIPWNSCGMTQSAVLGVPSLTFIPFCIFNYLCPVFSIIMASTGYKIIKGIEEEK